MSKHLEEDVASDQDTHVSKAVGKRLLQIHVSVSESCFRKPLCLLAYNILISRMPQNNCNENYHGALD